MYTISRNGFSMIYNMMLTSVVHVILLYAHITSAYVYAHISSVYVRPDTMTPVSMIRHVQEYVLL